MATLVFKNAYAKINDVDLSAWMNSISVNIEQPTVDDTNMGDNSLAFLCGLKNGTFTVNWSQDFAAAAVDASMWAIYDGEIPVSFILKPNGDTTAVANPKYTGNCILTGYTPLDGTVGDKAFAPCTFQITGDIARATAD
jgi:hypothetical protein